MTVSCQLVDSGMKTVVERRRTPNKKSRDRVENAYFLWGKRLNNVNYCTVKKAGVLVVLLLAVYETFRHVVLFGNRNGHSFTSAHTRPGLFSSHTYVMHPFVVGQQYLMHTDADQVQELLVALIPRLQNPRCLQGLLEMHLEPKQIHLVQV